MSGSQHPSEADPKEAEGAAIVFKGVAKRYRDVVALEPLDMEIGEGEFFCLLGPSGCGKTTTLNLLGGFVAPTAGAIYLRGMRLDRMPPHKRPVNTVFQSYALFPHMSVRRNIGFGLKMAKESRSEISRRVSEVLERVGLEGLGDRMPSELSGGQQQRVAVARALVNRPSVLLLDEPLGALDLKLRKRLQDELAEIHRSVRTTFVYVTHDQEEAMVLGTRIAVMNQGRLEQVGAPEEIYTRPRSRFVADFIGQANFLPVTFDGAQARTVGGVPVAVSSESFTTRGDATLVLRPEDVVLSNRAGDGLSLPAKVLHYAFLGTHTRVALSVDGIDDPFVVSVGGDAGSLMRPESGTELFLSWSPTAAVVVDQQPAAGHVQPQEEGDGIGIQPHLARRVTQA